MKSFNTIPYLSAILALSATSASAAATGYIRYYFLANCAAATAPGGVVEDINLRLDQDACADISPQFLSFKAGRGDACPAGTTHAVFAYPQTQCRGNAISAGPLPANFGSGDCVNILLGTSGGVSLGGRSAKLICA